ncbi:MAG: class I SAM-dependent methyltransferase [Mobilicoccus sp.]|nr:class I SAM-dependent methyltransferase [Mobilicoccus sp.]
MTRRRTFWEQRIEENPGHSAWYIQRWRTMLDNGDDIVGEARLIDAMAPRGARILDAGCGQGRVGGYLASCGHTVVGVDVDPALVDEAARQFPDATWRQGDLAELDLPAVGIDEPFDLIVCAGNVVTFAATDTQVDILRRFGHHLAPGGRAVVGFGAGRGYGFDHFFADVDQAGLTVDLRLAGWDLRPYDEKSDFLVAVLSRP